MNEQIRNYLAKIKYDIIPDMNIEKFPTDPIDSPESNPERVGREQLISLAREKPPQDPEVRGMLVRWLEETRIPEGAQVESVEYVDVEIMHTAMKYRLGFLSREDALEELEEAGGMLASEPGDTSGLHDRLSQLMYAIEDGTFEVIHAAE